MNYEINPNFLGQSDLVKEKELPLFAYSTKENDRQLSVLSLFSGCGGMDLGFEGNFICNVHSVPKNSEWIEKRINDDWVLLKKTRFCTIFANDILEEALHTWTNYMSRFGKPSTIYHLESIVELVKAHKRGANVFPKHVDVVTGGFPCQDFSVAGKRRGFNSETLHDGKKAKGDIPTEENRGKLYYWMKQVIDITKPNVFIAENVKGLVSLGDVREIIQRDFAEADGNGYVVLPPQVLHAGNYGVPETRERVIFIGIKRSALTSTALKELEKEVVSQDYNPYPLPTHAYSAHIQGLEQPVTCQDVLKNLPEPENSCDLSQRFYSQAKYMGKHCQGQTEIHLYGLGPTIRSEHHGNIEYRRLSKEHGGTHQEELEAGLRERRLTPRECALIQTFPPDYPFVVYKGYTKKFLVSQSGAYKVIGNAVPPILAYNIAMRIQSLWNLYFN